MLETIREYGLERLVETGETEATCEAHAVYYLALTEEAELNFKGAEQTRWFTRLEQEHENLRAALSWLLEHARMEGQTEEGRGQAERALRLCVALFSFWYNLMYLREGWSFLEQAVELREGVVAPLRAKVLYNAGFLLWHLNDLERTEVLTGESLTLCRELGDTAGVARALTLLGAVAWLRSQYAAARVLYEEAAALFQQVGDTWGRGRCLTDLARMVTEQGQYELARTLLEESLALYQAPRPARRAPARACTISKPNSVNSTSQQAPSSARLRLVEICNKEEKRKRGSSACVSLSPRCKRN